MCSRAFSAFVSEAGGADAVAAKLGVSRRTIFAWKAGRIPAERVPDVERTLDIPRHKLRPDLFPAPAPERAA